jgi:bacillolysin
MNMRKLYFSLIFLFLLITTGTVAQQAKKVVMGDNGSPRLIQFDTKLKAASTANAKQVLKSYLNLEANDDFKLLKSEKDQTGFEQAEYQQYFNGIPVEYGKYKVHSKNGVIHAINGDFKKIDPGLSVSPKLTEKQALNKALSFVNAQKYMWQDPDAEKWAKENEKAKTYYPKGELVVVENFMSTTKELNMKPTLAYKFNIYAKEPISRAFIYVDATTGQILHVNNIIKNAIDAAVDGTVATRYSGTKTIKTDSYNSAYRLRDYSRGSGIIIYDMNQGTSYSSAVDFTDADNNWTAAEFNNTAKDNVGLEAAWAFQVIYDYWSNIHGRNSFDNAGALAKAYVHYDVSYENAYWDGSVFTFGDGATSFDALACLDVSAHEYGHAVCEKTCNLTYSYESGALNEAFSDIWGAAAENYGAPTKSIWVMGEDIELRSGHEGLRILSNPNAEGLPDTYLGTNWYTGTSDYGGVHYNNGPFCYWFYLISVGGSGTNDNGKTYNISALGITKAEKIAYRMESVYMTSSSNYADARTYAIQSAIDLYGEGSNEVIQVTNAMAAIGVGNDYCANCIEYCSSAGSNYSYEWIASVQIGTFTNTSSKAGYTDFTSQTISLNAGQSYALTLTPGFASSTYSEYWKIWIDFNKDGDFADSGEQVFDAGALSKTAVTGNISIPSMSSLTTRMRVSMKYNSSQTYCETFSYGEVEDYTVAITGATSDTEAPSTPTGLASSNVSSSSLSLSWTASTDNVGVTGYRVYQNGTLLTTVTSTSANITGLSAGTTYQFYVTAIDAAGNVSAASSSIGVTTTAADTEAPTAPTNLAASNIAMTSLTLSWTASSDNVAVTAYRVYQNSTLITTVASTTASITGLSLGTTYQYYVTAVDAAGNVSPASNTINLTTLTDTEAPTAPSNLVASSITQTSLTLSWTASTDNVGVTGYRIYKNSSLLTTVTSATASITGLTAATAYQFFVTAIDAAGNVSSASSTISATTSSSSLSYCTSKGSSITYEWIDLVKLGSINNVTTSNSGYGDFTSLSTNLARGTAYTIYFSAGYKSTAYTEYWVIWIDYNQDGDFLDTGEKVASGSSKLSTTLSKTFTVPSTASLGSTRMRVQMKYNAAPTSCETFSYGEVEDYTVVIGTTALNAQSFTIEKADELGNENPDYVLFPNPAMDYLKISVPEQGFYKVKMYNSNGKLVKAIALDGTNEMDIKDLKSGFYNLQIDDGRKLTSRQFVKQ